MFSKFSEEAQKVLLNSKKEMQDLKHPYVSSEHLFLSLLKINKNFKLKMQEYGITYSKFKDKIIETVGIGSDTNNYFLYTPLLKRIIEDALLISKEASSNEVDTVHLIYALFEEGEGVAIRILNNLNIDIDELQEYYSLDITNSKKTTNRKKLLVEEFGLDLTKKALNCELDPVIGRENEIKNILEILCRRSKNNPLLVGEAGVGKTALVEELARLIVNEQVPDKLKNKRIISVSIASLVSGTKYRGEFEERVTSIIKELEEHDEILLFIDEIHTIMGAGGAEGAIDAANIFKPALSRGKIRLIGATTLDEYKQTIEKDRAMERRFQKVLIEEPNTKQVYNILKELKPIYEKFHCIKIKDEMLIKIIELSNKYIYDRYQPDKSIDILDEVCSMVSLKDRKHTNKLDLYKEELKNTKKIKNDYLVKQDYNNASKIIFKEKELISIINNLEIKKEKCVIKDIKLTDIAEVISRKTGMPIYEVNGVDMKYIFNLKKYLSERIVGQDHAISELVETTKRFKLGYKDDNKPISFLFVGPTGVGKTAMAINYSDYLFGRDKVIRIDGSEYKDITSINKILGSAPGYVGYNDNKNKLEEIRNNPNSLILFDEIEKAHPTILNLFLQILDNGKITDNKGHIINFKNNIIIMTSNIGFNKRDVGFTENISKNDSKLKEFIPLELLNRLKKVIYFNKMEFDDIYCIIKRKIVSVKKKFSTKNIKLHICNSTIERLVGLTRYEEFGARKIDQVIEDEIDNYVIDNILLGNKEITINY